jgi:hypothetical protein
MNGLMLQRTALLLLLVASSIAWPDVAQRGLQVDVKRDGRLYTFNASFDTSLSKCAAYHYLTDYEAATNLPGVIRSAASRQSANKVKVERTADEQILFFSIRLHSVMEYTEKPFDSIAFTQTKGDSRLFQGNWDIEPHQQGSTLRFKGTWEPDTLIPLFIIDHFAKNGLVDKFNAIAQLAEQRKETTTRSCIN